MRVIVKIAGAIAMVAAVPSHAAIITMTSSTIAEMPGRFSDDLLFAQFDPTVGTLTKVTVRLYTDFDAASSGQFDRSDASLHSVGFSIRTDLSDASGVVDLRQAVSRYDQERGCGFSCVGNPGDTTTTLSVSDSGSRSSVQTLTSAADFAPFVGLGDITITFGANSGYSNSNVRNASGHADAGGSVRVTYFFDPASVPEPTTWAMLLAGFGATGFAARRRAGVSPA